jgi:hypothetical protein
MGWWYGVTQRIPGLELFAIPTDRFELSDRIEKLGRRGINLEGLIITPMEGTDCVIWESRLDRNDPVSRLTLFYEARFSNGKKCSVEEGYAIVSDDVLIRGCQLLNRGPDSARIGRMYLQQFAIEMREWFFHRGYKAEIKKNK